MRYILYVDESGDQGLEKIRGVTGAGGATPFLTLGGVLVPETKKSEIRENLSETRLRLGGKALHCKELNHFETSFLAREVGRQRVLFFGVVSKKATLGEYRDRISGERMAEDYYNKCVQYLLELVGAFMLQHKVPSSDLSVVFEENKKHDYSRLRNFLRSCRTTPIDHRARRLGAIDPLSITSQEKSGEPLLALADVVAYSLFQSVDTRRTNFGIAEQRYLRELLPRFHREATSGMIANHGIKYINGPIKMGLSGTEMQFAMKMYSTRKSAD